MTDQDYIKQRTKKVVDCWIWQGSNNGRYGTMGKRGVRHFAHRFSYSVFIGKIPPRMKVCHTCDTPLCCNPEHLFLGTQRDNIVDAYNKGRLVPPAPVTGDAHHNAKLTDKQIVELIAEVNAGSSKTSVAKKYGISDTSVGKYVRGEMRTQHAKV